MTESDDHSNTRPISVAELLAKNGTIGAPPVGGRRRRRRGNADAVTVAELTGEIPIVRPDDPEPVSAPPVEVAEITPDELESSEDAQAGDQVAADEVVHDEALAEDDLADAAEVAEADDELVEVGGESDAPEPQESAAPPRRSPFGRFGRRSVDEGDAETMSPDPLELGEAGTPDAEEAGIETDLHADPEPDADAHTDTDIDEDDGIDIDDSDTDIDTDSDSDSDTDDDDDELPSYLRSSHDSLFGGQSVDTDRTADPDRTADTDDTDLTDDEPEAHREMSPLVHGLWVVGQSVVAVALGAGLFVAFDQLWKWNNIVALVLSVLVILGLVVGVRVVRKTEDIGSTLIAVAVGALVTLGPLALLQSG